MKDGQFEGLGRGDVIRHCLGSDGMVVLENYGELGVIVTKTLLIQNPNEWDLIYKANLEDYTRKDQSR